MMLHAKNYQNADNDSTLYRFATGTPVCNHTQFI